MKKLLGIMIALLIFAAPMAMYAQVEAVAGSLKIGAHLDASYQWSGESKKHPGAGEIGWNGYDSVNMGDVYVELTGKVGDRITFKILEGLVADSVDASGVLYCTMYTCVGFADIHNAPFSHPFTAEAYIDIKIIDQLKFRVGKQITPTLLANTVVHQSKVIHKAKAPLIANGTYAFNELWTPYGKDLGSPTSVTGAAVIASFSGVEASYTWFDNWLDGTWIDDGTETIFIPGYGDALYDFNKTKGGNVAVGYSGEVGPGKLAARGFYFDEDSEIGGIGTGGFVRLQGWGLGASYTHANFFTAIEYLNKTATAEKAFAVPGGDNDNNYWGLYFTVAGKFSGVEVLYSLDYVDLTDVKGYDSFDTEMWHTIGVNYWLNDNAMVGLNYVIKVPEVADGMKYPNINELDIFFEVDTL